MCLWKQMAVYLCKPKYNNKSFSNYVRFIFYFVFMCVYMMTKHFFRFNNIVFKTIFFVISFILERLICIKGSLPPQFVYIIFPHYQFLIPEFFFLSIIFGEKQAFGIYMPSTYKSYTRQFITRGENEHKSCVITKMIVFQSDTIHLKTYWYAKNSGILLCHYMNQNFGIHYNLSAHLRFTSVSIKF